MTTIELEESARIVEAELRKIREATGMRHVSCQSTKRDVYWYADNDAGTCAVRDTLTEAISSVEIQQRKAVAK